MKTIISFNQDNIRVSIAGITVVIDIDELSQGLKTIENFIWNIWPEDRKEDLKGSEFKKFFDKVEMLEPLVRKFLSCWEIEGNTTQTVTFDESGKIHMQWEKQSASFDMKKYMECLSELDSILHPKSNEPRLFVLYGINKEAASPARIAQMMDIDPDQIIETLQNATQYEYDLHEQLNEQEVGFISDDFQDWRFSIDSEGELRITHLGTDQSMEHMANNKIVFDHQPTFTELCSYIRKSIIQVTKHMQKHEGLYFGLKQKVSPHHVRMICDHYGFEAVINWRPEFETE